MLRSGTKIGFRNIDFACKCNRMITRPEKLSDLAMNILWLYIHRHCARFFFLESAVYLQLTLSATPSLRMYITHAASQRIGRPFQLVTLSHNCYFDCYNGRVMFLLCFAVFNLETSSPRNNLTLSKLTVNFKGRTDMVRTK